LNITLLLVENHNAFKLTSAIFNDSIVSYMPSSQLAIGQHRSFFHRVNDTHTHTLLSSMCQPTTHNSETDQPFLNYALSLFNEVSTDSAACISCKNNVLAKIVKVRQDIAVAETNAVTAHQYAVIAARSSNAVDSTAPAVSTNTAASAAHSSSSSSSSSSGTSTGASASISDGATSAIPSTKRQRDADTADKVDAKRSKTVTAAAVSGGSSSSSNSSI
jgi:hypothetical protein